MLNIRHDWLKHFFFGNVIATVAMVIVSLGQPFLPIALDPTLPLWASLAAAVGAGAGKEFYDRNGRGHVEFADFNWTVAGWCSVAATWSVS